MSKTFVDGFTLELEAKTTRNGRFYTIDGDTKYPSITTVLGSFENPALEAWKAGVGHQRAEKEKKRAADRGSAVHDMVEKFLRGDENPTEGHKHENILLFKQLSLPLKRINNVHVMEGCLFSDTLKVAGRVDCIAEYDGKLSVIDFKTSNGAKNDHQIVDYFLQTTAYAMMFEEMFGIQIEQVVILMATEKEAIPLVFKRPTENYEMDLVGKVIKYYEGKTK